ncbi:hypothetical protein V1284_005738 [Nitrobacteraceae bacterium AZCC 2299]
MFGRYAAEAELSPKMCRAWKAKLTAFMASVKHDDLSRLTKKDVINGKDDLLKTTPVLIPRRSGTSISRP